MPQFELIPHSWLSWDFSVVQGDSVVAEIEIPRWRKRMCSKSAVSIMLLTAKG